MSTTLSFDNLEHAFAGKSNYELNRAYLLFKAISNNTLVGMMQPVMQFSLKFHLPVKSIIRSTIFQQFVGGETIEECQKTVDRLFQLGVGSILDYSVEGSSDEKSLDAIASEIIHTIEKAKGNPKIPFSVFKPTGLVRFEILEKISNKVLLTDDELKEWEHAVDRVKRVCETAYKNNVRIFMDAEDYCIQPAIDYLAETMMEQFNKERAIVYNTIQLYRTDRLQFLKTSYEKARAKNYFLGEKLVRGAYMEKERERAQQNGYASPIQNDKTSTDRDYDEAVKFCAEHVDTVALCAGTHNEKSSYLLVELMEKNNIAKNNQHIWFSQLLGMSDHISFNLAYDGYNVCKYVPFGPIPSVMPYLLRRAKENTSVKGQTGRELSLILKEKERRKL